MGSDNAAKEDRKLSRQLAQVLGKVIALVLIVVMVVLVERYCQVAVSPFGPDAKIIAIDGDSLRAEDGVEYRLFGIDAPELHQSCNEVNGKPWQCGRAAKAKLTAIINRGNVTCEARAKDRFGRIVAVCSAEGVPDVGPANRIGNAIYSPAELRSIQEIITLIVFAGFTAFYFREPLTLIQGASFALIGLGAMLVFQGQS